MLTVIFWWSYRDVTNNTFRRLLQMYLLFKNVNDDRCFKWADDNVIFVFQWRDGIFLLYLLPVPTFSELRVDGDPIQWGKNQPIVQILKITSTKMLTFENLTSHLPSTLFVAVNLQFEAIYLLRSLQVEESHWTGPRKNRSYTAT